MSGSPLHELLLRLCSVSAIASRGASGGRQSCKAKTGAEWPGIEGSGEGSSTGQRNRVSILIFEKRKHKKDKFRKNFNCPPMVSCYARTVCALDGNYFSTVHKFPFKLPLVKGPCK